MSLKMTYADERYFVEPRHCFSESDTYQKCWPKAWSVSYGNQVNILHGFFYPVRSRGMLRALTASNGIQGKFKNMFYVFDMFTCGKRGDHSAVFGMEFDLRGK